MTGAPWRPVAPTGEILLSSAHWHALIAPDDGAGLTALTSAAGLPVLRPRTDALPHPFFLMAPYVNRIRDARFRFGQRVVQLCPDRDPHAIHGDVRRRPWRVESRTPDALTCIFDSRTFSDVNWPWAFSARVTYRLDGPHLHVSFQIENTDEDVMPAGLGLHPFFARQSCKVEPILQFRASGLYPTGPSRLPEGESQPLPMDLDFSAGRVIGGQLLDHVFSGWDGRARLQWPERTLLLTADPPFTYLVVFTAPDGSLALEPNTQATDAFNLASRGVAGTGTQALLPGECLAGTVTLTQEGCWERTG